MGIESPTGSNKGNIQERTRDHITSPHAEAILDIFEKYSKKEKSPVQLETVEDIFYSFIEHALEQTKLYSSEKYGVAFPYTRINIAELSKTIYAHYKIPPEQSESNPNNPEQVKHHKEFVFGSFLSAQNGNQFTFFEEAMHQVVKQLPGAIEAVEQGRKLDDEEIYVLGSPTNEFGTMSQQFLDGLTTENSFHQFGALYAEFVESQLPKDGQALENTYLYFYGISMGGSFATQTAEQLLHAHKITQDHEISKAEHLPFVQVRADTLPGSSTSPFKKWQIPLGFALDGVFTVATNPYTRNVVKAETASKEKRDAEGISAILEEQGMKVNMTDEQARMKKEAVWGKGLISGDGGVINALRHGIPIDPDLKLTEVRAVYDPLHYSNEFRKEVKDQRAEHPDSLGENLVSVSENRRRFGINQAHTLVFFRENELKRIEKAAADLEKLKGE